MSQVTLTATTAFGLEAVVGRELQQLGYEDQKRSDGRVTFQADLSAIARCNVNLRVGNRLLLQMGEFEAPDFDAFFDQIRDLPWENWIAADAQFPVTGSSQKSQLHSVPACQGMAKKAIAQRLEQVYGRSLPETGSLCPVHFDLRHDTCTMYLNTSGAGLHKRGYRSHSGEAPLRETLAAALVQLSVWKRDRPFIDPFCGSGTIAIEAALMARNIAPGLSRNYVAEDWPELSKDLWIQARGEAQAAILPAPEDPLLASDVDFRVLRTARENAKLAGVEDIIHFQQHDVSTLSTKKKYGCLITNPPYGQRLNDMQQAQELWKTLSRVTEDWSTWSLFVFVGSREFERIFGRKATRRRKLYNGTLECTYYQYLGDKPPRMNRPQPRPDEEENQVGL
ncbi:class I SAM-dependent RNA methyltransferase [bacterium]|uniref:rRNA (Guanine-N(2)-)-methyltransferase n=1 Tax=Rubinisphaera brasiliensis (strain ATCC 49424 / DSM 5305 / JCM 21570 / IAM 15109 / NBRC 103401 / IFAM 1448) TaxID=756272 RepID=F0SND9_RUBBR|nr:class I SAM-dependent RNA methyltransferase [Rubinisphaera brasiliensis]ADY62182.1 rRNA (guanine-N(2)-)-methyltransferase [Rubinisphaera brasiliensis DSM 5305]MBR9801815.1 class I SAM-dependent RNA methyltransferase [bacterium]